MTKSNTTKPRPARPRKPKEQHVDDLTEVTVEQPAQPPQMSDYPTWLEFQAALDEWHQREPIVAPSIVLLGVLAASIEIGPNLNTLLVPLVGALVLWFQARQGKQFRPNGGSSMRDAIDRIELGMVDLGNRVGLLEHPQTVELNALVDERGRIIPLHDGDADQYFDAFPGDITDEQESPR